MYILHKSTQIEMKINCNKMHFFIVSVTRKFTHKNRVKTIHRVVVPFSFYVHIGI